jgi:hypothetical protein
LLEAAGNVISCILIVVNTTITRRVNDHCRKDE